MLVNHRSVSLACCNAVIPEFGAAIKRIAARVTRRKSRTSRQNRSETGDPLQKNAPAANQAIRIAILRKMNRLEEAEAFTATINQALLSTEEQRLLALERPPPPLESCNSAWVGTNCG
ncbi:MAG: hypothetical protein EBY32_06435 [Proteobacteria bacterium]|nr:hypothetical protein [Pseudomonadota bacterium]